MNEKPLHVRVAEVLGWQQKDAALVGKPCPGAEYWVKPGFDPKGVVSLCTICHPEIPPRYDTDWSATGPLIERLRLAVWYVPGGYYGADMWLSNSEGAGLQLEGSEAGPTPLLAVCNMILALHAAGKLPK